MTEFGCDSSTKPSFHALAHLHRVLGDYRFQRIVTNDPGRLRVQEYRLGENANRVVSAVSSPTGEGENFTTTLDGTPGKLMCLQRMPFAAAPDAASARPTLNQNRAGRVEVSVDESPRYLFFEKR